MLLLAATPAKKVSLSNVRPFIKNETLMKELSQNGKLVSPIRKVPLGCKYPLLKHVVSHRRNVLMILNNRGQDLSLAFRISVEEFDYVIFVSSDSTKWFGCGK